MRLEFLQTQTLYNAYSKLRCLPRRCQGIFSFPLCTIGDMGDTLYLGKSGLFWIGRRGRRCACNMSRFPFPSSPQDLPLSAQLSGSICFCPCGRRIFSLRMEGFSFFSYWIPAMLLRTPLAPRPIAVSLSLLFHLRHVTYVS